ncbi:MAG: M48 family metalloprotease [Steroidobacteraceae bacterium]|nr:M48 family metalloprotease [Steroidobacteraceae bacterium]
MLLPCSMSCRRSRKPNSSGWRGLWARLPVAIDLFALRMAPSGGAALICLSVILPAFILYGPALVSCALLTVVVAIAGMVRGWRACAAARLLVRRCGPPLRCEIVQGAPVDILDVVEPIVASRRVLSACSEEEFRQVIGHEAAHVANADNLRLLLFVASPDVLAWLPGVLAHMNRDHLRRSDPAGRRARLSVRAPADRGSGRALNPDRAIGAGRKFDRRRPRCP